MKILAIDYGGKKIGLAISDELGLVAAPLDTIRPKNKKKAVSELSQIIKLEKASKLLIGLPYLDGYKETPHITEIKEFGINLASVTKTALEFWDESFSTQEAEKGAKGRKKKNSDSEAARIILQEYLDYIAQGKNSTPTLEL